MLLSLLPGHSFLPPVGEKREDDRTWGGKDRKSSVYLKGGIASNPLRRGVVLY